jgi:hypothetical protein
MLLTVVGMFLKWKIKSQPGSWNGAYFPRYGACIQERGARRLGRCYMYFIFYVFRHMLIVK